MSSFMLEILTPQQTLYWGRAISLTARAVDGDVQILPRHAAYVTALSAGEVRIHTEDKTCLHFPNDGGVLEVTKEKVSVLVQPVPQKD